MKVEAMQYTWNGIDGSYTDDADWTPLGVPLYGGDTSALIQSGTVTLSGAEPNGIRMTLAGTSAATQPNFVLDSAALGPDVRVELVPPYNTATGQEPSLGYATITVDGYDTTGATIVLGGQETNPDVLTIAIAPAGQLNQDGTVDVYNASRLQVNGTGQAPATLNNDGVINMGGGFATISADLVGSGTIAFLPSSTGSGSVEFGGAVSATQHVSFSSASSAEVRIDDPSAFHGVLNGFDGSLDGTSGSFHKVTLADAQATGTYFAQITPDAGALLVLNGQEVVGALTVTGKHGPNDFGFVSNPDGSTTLT